MMSLGLVFTTSAQETNDNIVDIIASDGRLDSLHASVVAAELADTLALADQSYTLFAPRDGDFSALEATYPGLTAALLANPSGDLTEILKYHVVAGSYTAAELIEMGTVTSLQGEELTITTQGERVFVNGARVITADTPAKNGIIHVINDILVPSTVTLPEPVVTETTETTEAVEATTDTMPTAADIEAELLAATADADGPGSIAAVLSASNNFSSLLDALSATGLAETFANPGNFTVFAPTDAAFAALGDMGMTEDELKTILMFHVVGDTLTRDQLATDDILPTLDGRPLFVNRDGSTILNISGAKVQVFNIPASNGIIHVIDRVLIP
jgi:transforming growth factor-beta-induced protein